MNRLFLSFFIVTAFFSSAAYSMKKRGAQQKMISLDALIRDFKSDTPIEDLPAIEDVLHGFRGADPFGNGIFTAIIRMPNLSSYGKKRSLEYVVSQIKKGLSGTQDNNICDLVFLCNKFDEDCIVQAACRGMVEIVKVGFDLYLSTYGKRDFVEYLSGAMGKSKRNILSYTVYQPTGVNIDQCDRAKTIVYIYEVFSRHGLNNHFTSEITEEYEKAKHLLNADRLLSKDDDDEDYQEHANVNFYEIMCAYCFNVRSCLLKSCQQEECRCSGRFYCCNECDRNIQRDSLLIKNTCEYCKKEAECEYLQCADQDCNCGGYFPCCKACECKLFPQEE